MDFLRKSLTNMTSNSYLMGFGILGLYYCNKRFIPEYMQPVSFGTFCIAVNAAYYYMVSSSTTDKAEVRDCTVAEMLGQRNLKLEKQLIEKLLMDKTDQFRRLVQEYMEYPGKASTFNTLRNETYDEPENSQKDEFDCQWVIYRVKPSDIITSLPNKGDFSPTENLGSLTVKNEFPEMAEKCRRLYEWEMAQVMKTKDKNCEEYVRPDNQSKIRENEDHKLQAVI